MLKPISWANAIAITTAVFYIVFWILSIVAPNVFTFLYNAQFFGANVASLYQQQSIQTNVIILFILVLGSWIVGYIWAVIYNWLAKETLKR